MSNITSDGDVVRNIVGHPLSVEGETLLIIDTGVLRPLLVSLHDVAADQELDNGEETALERHEQSDADEDPSHQLHSMGQHGSSY